MRALIRFDCFGVIFMTMIFTSSRFNPLIYRACCFLRIQFFCIQFFCPCPCQAASPCLFLSEGRGKVISHSDRYSIFKVLMKRPFTYSHWVNSNSNPKRKNICEFENPSHLFAQRVSKGTPVFWLSPKKLFEKFTLPPIPTRNSQLHLPNWKMFPNGKIFSLIWTKGTEMHTHF